MRTFDELEALYQSSPPPPRSRGTVALIVVRRGAGVHETPPRARIDPDRGLKGDRWGRSSRRNRDRQLTLMNVRVAELVAAGAPLHLPGDNLLVDLDLAAPALPAGTRLAIGAAILEVSAAPHTGCQKFSARFGEEALRWVEHEAHRERRLRGINCRVCVGGEIAVGDTIRVL